MPLRRISLALGLAFVVISGHADAAGNGKLVMPDELIAFAKQQGCVPIVNVMPLPDGVVLPFAYGYAASAEKEDSAVFWCRSNATGHTQIIFMYKEPARDTDGCPNVIKWMDVPGSLIIDRDTAADLDQFVYVDNPSTPGPAGVHVDGNSIMNYFDDGGGDIFICYQGKWFVRSTRDL